MAQTYANNDNVLSKVKFGNTTYYMKDAAARAILDTFGNATLKDVAPAIADGGEGLVTSDQVYDFVNRQIGAVGDILNLRSEDDHDDVESPAAGDFVVEADGSEWLYDGTAWREVGSEHAYVLKSFEIAGIDMQDNITVAELQQALQLGALAYKNSGSVKVTTIDSMSKFNTGAAGEYSVVASSVSVPATYSALDVTPAGSVTVEAGTAAAASYDKTTSVAISAAAPVAGTSVANYTPAGTVTVSNVTVTPSNVSVATVTDAGTAYQLQAGSMTQAADTKSAFATAGVTVAVDENDAEMLVFTDATTAQAVTASGTVTYVDPSLTGALPTFGSASVVSGISSASAEASFSGEGTVLSAAPAYTATAASVTQPTFTASFEGTSKTVTPAVATTVSAAGTDGKVTVASEEITPAFTATEKTATVTFA
jgi:hypothetical protein